MLVLASLPKLLQRALAPPELHTAVLFTSAGALVAFATAPGAPRPKDDVHVLVGLASEVWSETRVDDEGVVDSEVGASVFVLCRKSQTGLTICCCFHCVAWTYNSCPCRSAR